MKVLLIIVGSIVGLLFLALFAIGISTEIGLMPSTKVLKKNEIDADLLEQLRTIITIYEDESIEYFYSAGLFSYREDGNVVTDRRVISWEQTDGEIIVQSLAYADIEEVETEMTTSWIEDSYVFCWPYDLDAEAVVLWFSNEAGRDKEAVRYIERKFAAAPKPVPEDDDGEEMEMEPEAVPLSDEQP